MPAVRAGSASPVAAEPPASLSQHQARTGAGSFEALLAPTPDKSGKTESKPGESENSAGTDQSLSAESPAPEQNNATSKPPAATASWRQTQMAAHRFAAQLIPGASGPRESGKVESPDTADQGSAHNQTPRKPGATGQQPADGNVPGVAIQSPPVPMTPVAQAGLSNQAKPAPAAALSSPDPSASTAAVANALTGEATVVTSLQDDTKDAAELGTVPSAKVSRRAAANDQSSANGAATISTATGDMPGILSAVMPGSHSTTIPGAASSQSDQAMVSVAAGGLATVRPAGTGDAAGTPLPALQPPASDHPVDTAPAGNGTLLSPLFNAGVAVQAITPPDTGTAQSANPSGHLVGDAGEQVVMHVARSLASGADTVTVELHPAELGRVEIRFSFHADGLSVRMTIDRPETFDAFSRDRSGLEQQLAQAGVDFAGGGLDLRLGQQSGQPDSYSSGTNPRVPMPATPSASAETTLWIGNSLLDILA